MSASFLLIDLGNSRIKWATAEGEGPIELKGELPTSEVTTESIEALAREFSGYKVVLSSVVPKWTSYLQNSFHRRIHPITSDWSSAGLLFNYPKPGEIGADRLAAAACIRWEGICPAIIVQCGTATAFSVLDDEGRFCGGVIAPGPHAQLASLVGATAQLPMIEKLHEIRDALGTSTEEAIRIGVMLNYRGGVNEILRHLCRTNKPPLTSIILTGGNAHLIKDSLEFPCTLRPLLVFEGLRIIGLRAFKDI